MFGDAGNDRMVWNPGDDTDLVEGGADVDTAEVNGGNAAEFFTATANGTRVRFDRVDPAPFSLDIGTTEHLVVNMNGGNDSFSATGNLASLIHITVDGGAGDDTILGSNGATCSSAARATTSSTASKVPTSPSWAPAKTPSNGIRATAATRSRAATASIRCSLTALAAQRVFDISANGGRVTLFRSLGNIFMDLNDIERIDLNALGNPTPSGCAI